MQGPLKSHSEFTSYTPISYASCSGFGAGKIGRMIARFLMDSGDYDVLVGDVSEDAL